MKNKAAQQLGRLGGMVSSKAKTEAARKNGGKAALIKSGNARVQCNINHSGNTSLFFDVGYFQCQGCGHFHTPESVQDALDGPVKAWTGAGGVVRTK